MPRSMTAYARVKSQEIKGLSWTVELHSVNRKTLEIYMHLGKELLFLELEMRKMIAKLIHRGQVTVKVHFTKAKKNEIFLPLLKKLKTEFVKLSKDLHLDSEEVTLPFLLSQFDRLSLEDEMGEKIQTELKKTLEDALEDFIKMKEVEGKALTSDIKKRCKLLSEYLSQIEKESRKSPEQYQKKLRDRLKEILSEAEMDERVLREVAIFAEKVDITEEITRMRSHLQQTEELLQSKEDSVGRKLDFLIQEMLREINTIASKTPILEVTKKTIDSKAELEKIREQVQNIE